MPQVMPPFFPEGSSNITSQLAFRAEEGVIFYFNAGMPVFHHDESDRESFRMITAQFCVSGATKQMDIVRTFGVMPIWIKRAVKQYRETGPKGFFAPKNRRGAPVLTTSVLEKAQKKRIKFSHRSHQ